MQPRELAIFPVLTVVFALLGFFIGYGIAVAEDHVDKWLPFISDCGAIQPESSIFGQLINISAFFLAITVYLIHRNTVDFHENICDNNMGRWKTVSVALMMLGLASALGESIVANFQEGPQLITHDVGAFLFFIGITFYFWGQIVIAYKLRPTMVSLHLTNFRALLNLVIMAILVFHMTCLFGQPFVKSVNGTKPIDTTPSTGIVRHKKGDPFYTNWLATTISEWVLALLILLHILTYTYDLSLQRMSSSPAGSRASSTVGQQHVKPMNHENPIDHVYTENVPTTDAYYGTPSRRRLYRVDQVHSSAAYTPPRTLPRVVDVSTSNNDRYQYF
ncbi:hypothetical protein Q1695_000885 [Nippostrongylus brasiliensis]|nr:hypothetical protein Q1695_000885 [Nippostrongylus brasiliensis]